MTWRIVHIKDSDKIYLKFDNLEIRKLGETYTVPLNDISIIILEGNQTTITAKLLVMLSKHNIALIVSDEKYMPTGLYLNYGNYHHSAKRSLQQIQWPLFLKEEVWGEIIRMKIENQRAAADYFQVGEDRVRMLSVLHDNVVPGDKTNREGHAAKVYFNSLYGLDFTRNDNRIENYAMDYGYSIIRSAVARNVVGSGLLSMLGIFHKNEFNSFNLVDDLMEPFRPIMDYWINEFVIGSKVYLSYENRLQLIDFLNQEMLSEGKKSNVNLVIQKYVQAFIKTMETQDMHYLKRVHFSDFSEVNRK
ncbi:MAG: type II CRISPR-associated endonuclease Cas1 [Streptococcaceae bacterium]|jgi:CRISPR-associated protein Cas1|nr:type II CRISPR-associated endonuclease Cas1 [Streptococcaceae bacterium]